MNAQLDKHEYEYYAEQARKEIYYDMPYYDHVLWSKARKLKFVGSEPGKQRAVSSTNTCNICKKPVPSRRRFCDSCKKKKSSGKRSLTRQGNKKRKKHSKKRSKKRVNKRVNSRLIQL